MEKGKSTNEKDSESTTVKMKTETGNVELKRELELVSAISFNISCMIGSGIFVSPTAAFSYSGSIGMCIIVWFTCGLICLLNALVFAELGTVVPRSGSIYAYYTEAFNNLHPFWGPIPAFMYAILNTIILPPAGIAIITMSFAEYVSEPFFCILQLKTEIFGYEKKVIAIMVLGINK
ncbi:b(0,+)-type amino acid transporter 1-like [Chrysoperla carnea]|uniref:b(0,+)-type amino acid transporter 1-like n=1 Tax=Chrysoperla carnea TaxID=189513 RepID=UPI001D08FA0B|nr:b(0,+)-type amino acid transporter 1-like [Chrysoperla carnea]